MLAMTTKRLHTIQRASRALRGFLIFMAALLLLGTINNLLHPFPADTRTLAGVAFQGTAITGRIQILWLVKTVLGVALNLKILYHLIRLLGLYSRGLLFTVQNVAQIRQAAVTLMFAPAIWLIVLSGGWREIAAAQDQWVKIMASFPGGAVITAAVFLFAGRIMNEGRELRDEQDLVV